MPTLLERVRVLSAQITSLADSQVTANEAKTFLSRALEFSEAASVISTPTRRIELLRTKGLKINDASLEVAPPKQAVENLLRKYETDRRSVLTPDTNWRLVTKPQLSKLSERVNASLRDTWRSYVLSTKPNVDQGLLRVLGSSPAYAAHARRIEVLDSSFRVIAEEFPVTLPDADRPEQLAKELKGLLEVLPTDIPKPVRDLFVAINQGSATVADLTDEAVAWLREKDLLQTVRLAWRTA